MVVTKARYHLRCLVKLYIHYHEFMNCKYRHSKSEIDRAKLMVLSVVFQFMEMTRELSNGNENIVSKLTDLTSLYNQELELSGAVDDDVYVHKTRF